MNDKIKHIIAGAVIGLVSALLIKSWDRDLMILGALVALIAGLAKEFIWDRWLKRGTFEWEDIYFTCWGGLLATILWLFL